MYSMEVCVSTVSIIVGDDALGVPIFLTNWINGDYHNNVTPNNSTSKIPKPRRYLSERDAHFCETEIASLPYKCGGQVFRLPNRVVIVGLFLRRANGVRPYDFVAVGFSLFYSIFKLHSEYDTGYYALGFVYTKYHNARPRPDTSTLQPVPESLIVFTKSQGLYVPASI